jgi:hypothetical protein
MFDVTKKLIVSILFGMAFVFVTLQFAFATAAAASSQTLSIVGAQGPPGQSDPYTEFSLDNGQTWRRAYLYGVHPWGVIEGTNSWINCGPSGSDCAGMDVLYRVRFILPDDFSNPQTLFHFKADNAVTISLNNTYVSDITTEGTVTGDTYANGALKAGVNEIGMVLHDYGGLTGLNYKITINVEASEKPTAVTAPLSVLPAPTFGNSPAVPTRDNVSVTIIYPADAVLKEYSFNGVDWINYYSAVVMTDNGTIHGRWKDSLGIVSSTGTFTVSNIDRTAPTTPTLSATPTTPTNGDVMVTVAYPDDSALNKYILGTGEAQGYSGSIKLSVNNVVYAYAVDAAGNISGFGTVTVNNIDKTPPTTPSLFADIINPTLGVVRVTLSNWGDATVKEYRINGGDWKSATDASEVAMTANGTVEARGQDRVGNKSAIGLIQINNIVADQDPLNVAVAAMNANGTEIALLFNHILDIRTPLTKEKFHLSGAAVSISSAGYASNQVVVLKLSDPYVSDNEQQRITLDVDYEAVKNKGGKPILEWRGLPVKSLQEANLLRERLRSLSAGNPAGAIRIDSVVKYMIQSHEDVTGDGIFDRNDVLFLLLQLDSPVME